MAYEKGFKAAEELYKDLLSESRSELKEHEQFVNKANKEIIELKNHKQLTVWQFVSCYVAHNATVYIYDEHFEIVDKVRTRHTELLWKGAEWLTTTNQEDIEVAKSRGFEMCPYRNEKVVGVRSVFGSESIMDIGIVIERGAK